MIFRPEQIRLLRMTGRAMPCNFGGDSSSDSSTDTRTNTTNNVNEADKRNVASDAAVAISGDGNAIDRSSSNVTSFLDMSSKSSLTSFVDSSNRSTSFADLSDNSTKFTDTSDNSYSDTSDRSTKMTDTSNRSVNMTDWSNRSVNMSDLSNRSNTLSDYSNRSVVTTNTNTDFGAVNAALLMASGVTNGSLALAGSMSSKAFDSAGATVDGAISVLKNASADNMKSLSKAFDAAAGQSAMAQASSAAVMGFASDALKATQGAMETAKDGGQSKMVLAALAVAGAIGVAVALN